MHIFKECIYLGGPFIHDELMLVNTDQDSLTTDESSNSTSREHLQTSGVDCEI